MTAASEVRRNQARSSRAAVPASESVTTPISYNPGGLSYGANPGAAVTANDQAPLSFTGTLHTVTVDLSGDLITDTDSEMCMTMARQ